MAPVKVTLSDVAQRLELRGEKFVVCSAAHSCDIAEVWGKLKEIDPAFSLSPDEKITHQKLTPLSFMKHCCHERHYFFDIKKCGDEDCNICLPPRLHLISFHSWIIFLIQCLVQMVITRSFQRFFKPLL